MTSQKCLRRLAKKLKVFVGYTVTLDEAITKLKQAYAMYKQAKKSSRAWCIECQESLCTALAGERRVSKKVMRRMVRCEQDAWEKGLISRSICGCLQKYGILQATCTCLDTGQVTLLDTFDPINTVAADSNCICQQQCKLTPFT